MLLDSFPTKIIEATILNMKVEKNVAASISGYLYLQCIDI